MEVTFDAELYPWEAGAGWVFITVPADESDAIDDATGSGIRAVEHELDKTGDTASIGQRFVQQRDLLLLVNIVRAAPRLTRQSE